MIQQRVQDKLFSDNLVPPSFKQRYWLTAAALAALGFCFGYAMVLFICWRNLPWAPLDMGSIQARTILYHQFGSLVNAVIPFLFSGEAEVLASFEASYGSAAKSAMDLRVALATLGGLGLGDEVVNEYKLELLCEDNEVEPLKAALVAAARTGQAVAGWITVIDVISATPIQ